MTERVMEPWTPADLMRRLDVIEQRQDRIAKAVEQLHAAVVDLHTDVQINDPQFVDAFARMSSKLNTVIAAVNRLNGRQRAPQTIDDLVERAFDVWERKQARPL